jgi:hypothetical protein
MSGSIYSSKAVLKIPNAAATLLSDWVFCVVRKIGAVLFGV